MLPIEVHAVDVGNPPRGQAYRPVRIETGRGEVETRAYGPPNAPPAKDDPHAAVVWVGGVGGGWDSPARHLYPRLAEELAGEGIRSLRVRYRYPARLEECVHDALAGLRYLEDEGATKVALVGHSLGGAVVIQAGARDPRTRAVVTLATQAYGTDEAHDLPQGCRLLLLHGTRDRVLPAACSQYVYARAHEPKESVTLEGAGHNLDEAADQVTRRVQDWLRDALTA